MYITVVGGGNSTPIFACQAKLAGHEVAILTRKPEKWSKTVGFENQDKNYLDGQENFEAEVDLITSDAAECIPKSDMIFIAGIPIHHNPIILKEKIAPHLNREKEVFIGSVCGYGAFNWVAADVLGEGKYVLFATQLIPWTCGTLEYGKRGVVFGAKRMLRIVTEDGEDKYGIKGHLKAILKIPELRDSDFLASCFWPNNPSLHPPILYGIFKDWTEEQWKNGEPRDTLPVRIYADLTPGSADSLAKLDNELVSIVKALSEKYPQNKHLQLDFSLRSCILENYTDQVQDDSTLETTVKTNTAFGKHNVPYEEVEGKEGNIRPILAHKFFETDLPFGLLLFKQVANMLQVKTPEMDDIIRWNQKLINKEYLAEDGTVTGKDAKECVLPSLYGLDVDSLDKGKRTKEE